MSVKPALASPITERLFTYRCTLRKRDVERIDRTTQRCALTPIAGSPFVTGTQPSAIAISD